MPEILDTIALGLVLAVTLSFYTLFYRFLFYFGSDDNLVWCVLRDHVLIGLGLALLYGIGLLIGISF